MNIAAVVANPDRWRQALPGEYVLVMTRWEIEEGDWDLYKTLCEYPNRFIEEFQQVIWIVPPQDWLLMVLRWPHIQSKAQRYEPDTHN